MQRRTEMGARPQIIFLGGGLKTEKSEWRHLANADDLHYLRYDYSTLPYLTFGVDSAGA